MLERPLSKWAQEEARLEIEIRAAHKQTRQFCGPERLQKASRKGNCYDNTPMESFWGMLKQELIHHRRYSTRQEAITEITEYIEVGFGELVYTFRNVHPET